MKKTPRWLLAALASNTADTAAPLPWTRGQRRRPAALRDAAPVVRPNSKGHATR